MNECVHQVFVSVGLKLRGKVRGEDRLGSATPYGLWSKPGEEVRSPKESMERKKNSRQKVKIKSKCLLYKRGLSGKSPVIVNIKRMVCMKVM